MQANLEQLKKLREPFPSHLIDKLPKPTKQQTDEVRADYKKGVRCQVCGGWHHPSVVHLDYVGHAALTDRLLDVDPEWSWKPLSLGHDGLPALDKHGGMWIELTVCGVTRIGYGHAGDKTGGDAIKEIIGDAMRNSAMRFGAALDLWCKGDLHADDQDPAPPTQTQKLSDSTIAYHLAAINGASDMDSLKTAYSAAYEAAKLADDVPTVAKFSAAKDAKKKQLQGGV